MTEGNWKRVETHLGVQHELRIPEGRVVVAAPIGSITNLRYQHGDEGYPVHQGWVASPRVAAAAFAAGLVGGAPASVEEVAAAAGYVPMQGFEYPGRVVRRWTRKVRGGWFELHEATEGVSMSYEANGKPEARNVIALWTFEGNPGRPFDWPAALVRYYGAAA